MNMLFYVWDFLSGYKFGNDLRMVSQGKKSPLQASIETYTNEHLKSLAKRNYYR